MRDTIRYCPSCHEWHTPHDAHEWRCTKCITGASLAVLWWFAAAAVVFIAIAAWICWKGFAYEQ